MIIGIVGRKGAGKDTIGERLVEQHGFKRVAFADPVKWIARSLFPTLTHEQCWGPIAVKEAFDPALGATPRQLLQLIGTEVGRQGQLDVLVPFGVPALHVIVALERFHVAPGPTAWIDALARNLQLGVSHVVTDVRFPNEAEAVRKYGLVVRVTRPGFDTGVRNDHASETEVDACAYDMEILNSGTLEDLHAKVDALVGRRP